MTPPRSEDSASACGDQVASQASGSPWFTRGWLKRHDEHAVVGHQEPDREKHPHNSSTSVAGVPAATPPLLA